MAYRAEIEVGVRGAQQLQDLREKINALSRGIDLVNTKTFFGTDTVASIRNYNSALADAQENLNKTRLRLNEAGAAAGNYAKAIDQYVTALQNSNGAQELTNRLISEEIELRRKQKLAASGIRETTQYSGPIGPGPASPIDALVGQSSPVGGRVERIRELETAAIAAANAVSDLAKKQDSEITQKELENDERVFQQKLQQLVQLGNKELQINKMVNDEALRDFDRRLAARQPQAGFKTEGPLKSPGFKAMQKRIGGLGESLALGAGFPLLFGGGPGSVIGSVLGSFVGSGFGGQILGGALGQSLDQAVQAAAKLGNSFALISDNYSSLREQGIAFTAEIERQVTAAKELGDYTAAQELMRGAVGQQTGDLDGLAAQAAGHAVNELEKAWNGVTKAVQTLLGFLGTPIMFALAGILRGVQAIVAVVNVAISGLIRLTALIPGLKDKMDKAYEESLKGTAEYENQLSQLNKQTISQERLIELETKRTAIKARMVGATKEQRLEANKELKELQLSFDVEEKIRQIRAGSAGATEAQKAQIEKLVEGERKLYRLKKSQAESDYQAALADERRNQLKKEQLKLQKEQESSIRATAMLGEGLVKAELTNMDRIKSINSAAQSAYLAINDLEMQRAKNAGNTERQYRLQLERAQLIYQQTVLQVQQEQRKAELAVISNKIELKKLEALVAQKAAKGEAFAADYAAIELQKQAVQLAYEGVAAAQQIAQFNLMGANAVRQMTIEQLEFNRAKKAGTTTGGAAIGGGMAAGGAIVTSTATTRSQWSATPEQLARALSAQGVTGVFTEQQASQLLRQAAQKGTTTTQGYAEGGFVTRPTNAMVGEGGQPEYVIPASKMNDAMRRYSAGTRGEAVVNGAGASGGMNSTTNYSNQQNAYYGSGGGTSVNITTGPVMRLGNKNYVTVSDMQRGMAAAVGAAEANMMNRMSRSYAARRSMGL